MNHSCTCLSCQFEREIVQQRSTVTESQEVTIKFTADEYARLVAAWSGSGMQDTKTGFVKRAAIAAVELLEGD